jgi:uroporphyrinogen-III synthase
MLALVTRPQPQADVWVKALQARGVQAEALPLLVIGPAPDLAAVARAQQAMVDQDVLMFVSPNAVEQFFAASRAGWCWPVGAQALATGPGTVAALVAGGVPPGQISSPALDATQFDSESLWAQVRHQPWAGRRVTVVRGEGGRDWLATTLTAAGAQVDFLQSYARRAPEPTSAFLASLSAWQQRQDACWLLSSSEAVDHLATLLPGADWSGATALASHPRINQHAQRLGFGRVLDSRPTLDAVVQALQAG